MAEADPGQFCIDDTRASYDAVAERYAQEIYAELGKKPFDREFLDRFADAVRGRGRVVELGCGPGHVAGYLAVRGVDVSGLDLAPAMIEVARRRNPEIEFDVGDMLDLPFGDGSLAAVVCFYSIIHFDDRQLAVAFAEMSRVLRRGGLAAFAFHIGDEVLHRDQWWDTPVDVDFRFLQPDHVIGLLLRASFEVSSREERDPYAPDVEFQSRRAYLITRRLRAFELGYPKTDLRRKLVDAVLRGDKTATAGLATDHAPHTDEPLPRPGDRWALVDYDDKPVAIVETTDLSVVPAGEVDLEFARDEGEGFESVAEWRAAHERFWHDQEITDETLIVCERFTVVERFD